MSVACFSAFADAGYLGLGYGMTSFKIDCASLQPCDKSDSGAKAYVGVNVAPAVALELGYLNFGKATLGSGANEKDVKSQAFVADAAFRVALIPEFGLVGRLGVSSTRSTLSDASDGSRTSKSVSKPYWGFGVEYQVNKNFKAVAAADFVKGDVEGFKGSGEMYSVGAQVGF